MTKAWDIGLARVYDDPGAKQGARLLVDRVWPRGIRRADLALDDWIREIGPSSDLRSWFGHDPDRWNEFRRLYRAEPDAGGEALERCLAWCRKGPVTLLYGARDDEHNQAVVLLEYLLERLTQVDAA